MVASAELLDRLLVATCETSLDTDVAKIAGCFVPLAADAFSPAVVGLRVPRGEKSTVVVRSASSSHEASGDDASRLFQHLEHERIIEIPSSAGATLHVASNSREHVRLDDALESFLERLVMTIDAALVRARLAAELLVKHARLHAFDAKFVQANRLASFGQIAVDIVHELNSPLTSMLAYSDYLHQKAQRSGFDPADVERLARLQQSAQRIHAFTRDLLAYARPRQVAATAVAIHDVIEQALVFCDYVLDEFGVTVERMFGDVPAIRGIPDQLTQIFVNLFTNAAHAMRGHGGRLTIRTNVVPGTTLVRIIVEDEGHGISPEHLEKIFEPYFTTKPEGVGTGLGLSIVRNIVNAHGGHIRAYARTNQGAVFEVDLPRDVRPNELEPA
ncbi:MAG TPA: ATP-binding protein [Polyangium sp.]|nr:ATP-binding protein [Polyangium sp.]